MLGIALSLGPATALALSEIPIALSGAASVLIILARQVGGTIGSLCAQVAVIERQEFHNEMFGAQVNATSPVFQEVNRHLQTHLMRNTGAMPGEAVVQAEALVRGNVLTQSHATSINDAFFMLGIILLVITLGLILEMALPRHRLD
jgi:hypothetical protein